MMIPTYLPRVALTPELRRSDHLTRERVTIFLDIAGFTGLSERLARHGTAGTEQLGVIIRQVIGSSIDRTVLSLNDLKPRISIRLIRMEGVPQVLEI